MKSVQKCQRRRIGVRDYVDAQGTAWLNVEDVARGLGFVETKKFSTSGENYVRWERINSYLAEYDYSPFKCGEVKNWLKNLSFSVSIISISIFH